MDIDSVIQKTRNLEVTPQASTCNASSNSNCLLQLPPEIKLLIIEFLQGRDLKSIRSTHRSFTVYATKLLFKEIHLSSRTNLFLHYPPPCPGDNGNEALEYTQGLVEKITFHTNVFQRPAMGLDEFTTRLEENFYMLRAIRPNLRRVSRKELHRQYESIIWDSFGFSDHLATKISQLKSLESFEIRRDVDFHCLCETCSVCLRRAMDHGPFFASTGIQPDGWLSSVGIGQLLDGLVEGSHISKLVLFNMDWGLLNYIPGTNALKELAPRLRELTITLAGGTPERITFSSQRQSLSRILSACKNLYTLNLSFDSVVTGYFENEPYKFVLFSQIFPDWDKWTVECRPFPRLTTLRLESFYISRQQLSRMLSVHISTLKHLELSEMDLQFAFQENLGREFHIPSGNTDFSGVDAWSSVFKEIRGLHNLHSLTLDGRLTNQWDEGWLITPSDDATSWVRRVVDYVLRKRDILPLPDREKCLPGTCYADLKGVKRMNKRMKHSTFQYDRMRLWHPELRDWTI